MSEKYKIQFQKFESGKDIGQSAVATANIDLGGGNVLRDQNVVVRVKHTKNKSETFTDGIRNRDFDKGEQQKVKELVVEEKLDIYIIVTNFQLPAGQCDKLEETFKNCGAKEVIVIGNETLTQWLGDSQELQKKVLRLYRDDITGLSMNDN